MGKFLTQQQLQQLLTELCDNLPASSAADIASSLWALAVMHAEVQRELLQQILSAMCKNAESAGDFVEGHQIATALWAAMQLQQQMQARLPGGSRMSSRQQLVSRPQLQQLVSGLTDCLDTTGAACITRSLQACMHFR
jgi:hypothetical protein